MEKYKFAYIVEVSAELLTDDKELVQQLEEENDVKVPMTIWKLILERR